MIIEYGMPGHGPIVDTCIIKRNVTPLLFANRMESSCSIADKSFPFRICVRKRPMADYERSFGSYDVCNTKTKNHVTLHEGKLARNGRQLSMTHYEYVFDEVYGEKASNSQVCAKSVEPLLSWAIKGNQSSLLCFGQTGTGKTYTLYGALDYISHRLADKTIRITFYEVHGKKCYDLLRGRSIVHLRSDEHENMHVRGARKVVLKARSGGAEGSSSELMAVLKEALTLRSSEMTERNPISSRSHAVCTIEIALDSADTDTDNEKATAPAPTRKSMSLGAFLEQKQSSDNLTTNDPAEHITDYSTNTNQSSSVDNNNDDEQLFTHCGRITLVDLAGSERNYETVQMSAQQHKESADINFALMALKDCFRAYHQQLTAAASTAVIDSETLVVDATTAATEKGEMKAVTVPVSVPVRIPYRSSLLTKVLKECFTCDSAHRTTIIATVSPTPVDLLHTVNTLSHVILMSPTLSRLTDRLTVEVPMVNGSALSTTPVSDWTAEQVNAWLGIAENGRFSHVVLPPKMDGSKLLHLTATNLAELFTTQENTSRREKEGRAWVVSAEETDKQYDIASALWSAVRREQQSALVKVKLVKSLKDKTTA